MDKRLKNMIEVGSFVNYWRGKNNIEVFPNEYCYFNCSIKYMKKKIEKIAFTKARISCSGYGEGKIVLDENSDLNSENLHLDFSPDFQEYEFQKKRKSLKISGSSPKMNGKYVVIITPI